MYVYLCIFFSSSLPFFFPSVYPFSSPLPLFSLSVTQYVYRLRLMCHHLLRHATRIRSLLGTFVSAPSLRTFLNACLHVFPSSFSPSSLLLLPPLFFIHLRLQLDIGEERWVRLVLTEREKEKERGRRRRGEIGERRECNDREYPHFALCT